MVIVLESEKITRTGIEEKKGEVRIIKICQVYFQVPGYIQSLCPASIL